MKKLLYFVVFSCLNFLFYLYNKTVCAQDFFTTATAKYGVQPAAMTIRLALTASTLILLLIWIPLAVYGIIKFWIKICCEKNEFDYKSEYKKFKPKTKVKITFTDENGKTITKRCRIISINDKEISFQNKSYLYECKPADIKKIQKRSKHLLLFIIVSYLLVLVIIFNKIIAFQVIRLQ
ncbi:MAG: hypothetical protein J6Y85_04035 [Alphaproteobacteria bacterium]|nr:hypothetical protein [Alphaproteobacteria bacterium]